MSHLVNQQDQQVKSCEQVTNFHLYKKTSLSERVAEVELSKVVGTNNSRYNHPGMTWSLMRDNLQRGLDSNQQHYADMVRDNIDHSAGEQPITLKKYGEEYIIYDGGNHRICNAKFAGLPSIRVNVKEYELLPTPAPVAPLQVPVSRWAWFHKWVDSWLPG